MTEPAQHHISRIDTAAALSALFADVARYNAEISAAGSAARAPHDASSTSADTERQQNRLEEMRREHAAVLGLAGLEVKPAGGASSFAISVVNRAIFREFLGALDPDSEEFEALKPHLSELPRMLAAEIRGLDNPRAPTDREIQMLISVNPLLTEYQRLGLADACAPLAAYAEQLRNRCLAEYLMLERAGLLESRTRGYAPGDSLRDPDPTRTRGRWQRALSMLESLGKRQETGDLQQHTALVLDSMLESARLKAQELALPRRAPLLGELRRVEERLAPFVLEARVVFPEMVEALSGSLADLQRAAAPHLFVLGNVLAKDMSKPESRGVILHHRRSGDIFAVAYACLRPESYEADATIFVHPERKHLDLEFRLLSELEDAVYPQECTALHVAVPSSQVSLLLALYGDRAKILTSVGATGESMLRIELLDYRPPRPL